MTCLSELLEIHFLTPPRERATVRQEARIKAWRGDDEKKITMDWFRKSIRDIQFLIDMKHTNDSDCDTFTNFVIRESIVTFLESTGED